MVDNKLKRKVRTKFFRNSFLLIFAWVVVTLLSPFIFFINVFRFYNKLSRYLWTISIGLDQLGGSILYNEEDWTVSSYTYYLCEYKHEFCWFMKFINFLFGKDHCKNSYEWEKDENKKPLV